MSKSAGGSTPRRVSSSSLSGGQSVTVSPSGLGQHSLPPSSSGMVFGLTSGTEEPANKLTSDWQVWSSNTNNSRRISSSSAVVSEHPPQRSAWETSRSSSGNWEMTRPVANASKSPNTRDFSQQGSQSGWGATSVTYPTIDFTNDDTNEGTPIIDLHQLERPSGLSRPSSFSPRRYSGGMGDSAYARYGSSQSPTSTVTPYNSTSASQPGPTDVSSEDLTHRFRGMAIGGDHGQGNLNISYHQQQISIPLANVPSQQPNLQQNYGHHMVSLPPPRPPSLGSAYQPQTDHHSAYFPGHPSVVAPFQYNYDAYRPTPDISPIHSHVSIPTSGMHGGVSPYPSHPFGHRDIRAQAAPSFDYSSMGQHPSQYFLAHPMTFPTPAPQLPLHVQQVAYANHLSQLAALEMQGATQRQHVLNAYGPSKRASPPMRRTISLGTYPGYPGAQQLQTPTKSTYGEDRVDQDLVNLTFPTLVSDRKGQRTAEKGLITRSRLLEEFRLNRSRNWELKELVGHVVEFSGDQYGSRFIQHRFESATDEEKHLVFAEIHPDSSLQLMQDVFGNYVIQKIFEHGAPSHRDALILTMKGHITELSLEMYGCRVVQKAIEYIPLEQQATFVEELAPRVLDCVMDANGNHVIQKLIEHFAPECLDFVQSFNGHVKDLASHPYGCRVLQRCLEYLPEAQTRPLLDGLLRWSRDLMQNQFGNYIIQHILKNGTPSDRLGITSGLRGHMLRMSRHKYASNVCEKALETAEPEVLRILVDELMTPVPKLTYPILAMMRDQYANYVLHTALTVVEGEQKERLIALIRPHLSSMRKYASANKHLIPIEKLVDRASDNNPYAPPVY